VIDTLKMARVLEKAGLNREGAEDFAEELRDQIDSKYVTRDHFDARMDSLYHKILAAVAAMIFAHFVAVWFYVGSKMDAVDGKLDAVNARLGALETNVAAIAAKLDAR
jgi:hypothetical protein